MHALGLFYTRKRFCDRMQDMGLKELLDREPYSALERLYDHKRTLRNVEVQKRKEAQALEAPGVEKNDKQKALINVETRDKAGGIKPGVVMVKA